MKRIIISLLTVVMLVLTMLPAGVPLAMGQDEDASAATNQTAPDQITVDLTADDQTTNDHAVGDETAGGETG
ncbi:MAG: hypothetical protein ACUVTR_07375, partial [Dehalococcoidia bacterium]